MANTSAGGNRGGGIRLVENTLLKGIKTLPGAINRAAAFTMQRNAGPIENWMKSNAPWTDQTTNARNGLAARYAGSQGGVHVMVLFHQVEYGIWLEVKNSGEYAVILPAVQYGGEVVMQDLVRLLDRMGPGGTL